MAANITERDDGNIRARMRLAVTVFGIVGAVVTFLIAVSSSILSLVTRTDLSTGFVILSVACYISTLFIFDSINGPSLVEEGRVSALVFMLIMMGLCAFAALAAVLMSNLMSETYGYDFAVFYHEINGEIYAERVIYFESDIRLYGAFLLAFAITIVVLFALTVCIQTVWIVYFGKSSAAACEDDEETLHEEEEAVPAQKTVVEQETRTEYGGEYGDIRSLLAAAEKMFRSGALTEDEYHAFKMRILAASYTKGCATNIGENKGG